MVSILAQCFQLPGTDVPDVKAVNLLAWWNALAALQAADLVLAYHDISDGGLLATVCEMAFASQCGATLIMDLACQPDMGLDVDGCELSTDTVAPGGLERVAHELFCEAPGAIIEVARADASRILAITAAHHMATLPQTIGYPGTKPLLRILRNAQTLVAEPIASLHKSWTRLAKRSAGFT